ncbi:MAG TPA: IS3 family transposase [Blastocatellia bacterium]|nr:IS3 family transposase [Blastocatellia bacterium]
MTTLISQVASESSHGARAIKVLSAAVGVSRASFYRHRHRVAPGCGPNQAEPELRRTIEGIALEMPNYGYRSITAELQRRGLLVNRKHVLRLMRQDNLLCRRKRSFVVTTDSNHSLKVFPNLARNLKVTAVDQLWVADITYIRLPREFVYLAVVLDAFSRRVIGWSLDRHLTTALTLKALQQPLATRTITAGLVHHSDRGVQYAAADYVSLLIKHQIRISMSRPGNPYDNAKAERFMRTIKYDEVHLSDYQTLIEARASIRRFIEDVYNRKRLHSALGYRPPVEFEQLSNQ